MVTKKKLLICVIIVIIILIIIFVNFVHALTTFSIEKWNENVYQREWMLNDFLEKYNLVGMSYGEIINLLGSNYFDGNKYLIGKSYVGPKFFSITFDKNNKVESYGIIVD